MLMDFVSQLKAQGVSKQVWDQHRQRSMLDAQATGKPKPIILLWDGNDSFMAQKGLFQECNKHERTINITINTSLTEMFIVIHLSPK